MNVTITKEMAEAIGPKSLKKFGIDEERYRWNSTSLNLRRLSNNQVKEFQEILDPHHRANVKGARVAMRDIKTWIDAAAKGVEKATCKDVKQFESLAFEFLQKQPGHRLYKKDDERDVWQAFFVNDIQYHPPQSDRSGGHTPPYTSMKLHYMELGSPEDETENFYNADVRGKTVPEILTAEGYIVETDDLRANYLAEVERYVEHHDKIGRQFWATGIGTNNIDGNNDNSDNDRWSWYGVKSFQMARNGERGRVVIDVVQEGDKKEKKGHDHFNYDFWRTKSMLAADDDSDAEVIEPEDVDPDAPVEAPEIPLFPVVPVFDLKRHLRLRVHISNLEQYVYDTKLGEKLVLPDESRHLIEILLQNKGEFKDIISGKGGGASILSAGPPGVGKTLTAEVFAEVDQRPLYSVQCSQLGTDEEALEKSLLKVFARSQRWNAILLLDEADVYVAMRGSDLRQNAIVGVFLRVLEYYQGILFMTTNRADLVDDAISSRCIARLEYQLPTQSEQAKIWKILSDVAGVEMEPKAIAQIVIRYPKLSGRDVKQLLKLAGLVARARGETQVTAETIEFVKRFKPSSGDGKAPTAPAKVSP
jgi:hypothetical protein